MNAQNENIAKDQELARGPDLQQQQLDQAEQAKQAEEVAASKEDPNLDGVQADPLMKVMLSSVVEGTKRLGGLATSAGVAVGLLSYNDNAPAVGATASVSAPQASGAEIAPSIQPQAPEVAQEAVMSPPQVVEQAVSSVGGLSSDVMAQVNQIREQFGASLATTNIAPNAEQALAANLGDQLVGTDRFSSDLAVSQGASVA